MRDAAVYGQPVERGAINREFREFSTGETGSYRPEENGLRRPTVDPSQPNGLVITVSTII